LIPFWSKALLKLSAFRSLINAKFIRLGIAIL